MLKRHLVKQPRIGIVGAGIAGLNAALTLQDAGLSCDIYEASSRIGGRMHSDTTTWADGMVTEYCGEFIDSDHTTLRQLVARFDLELIDLGQQGADDAERIMYFRNHYYRAADLARDFQAIAPILQHQFHKAGFPTTYNHSTDMGHRLDHVSVYDWVEQYVEGGHDSSLGRMLNGACRGFYGLEPQEQSALNLVYMFASRTFEDDDESNSGPMHGVSKIAGGNQRLPEAIAEQLPDASIHLNHQLAAIRRTNDETALTFFTSNGVVEVTYDHVILALPFSTLRRVDYRQAGFDTLKQTAIEQLGYGTISKLMLQFDTPYWYREGIWPSPNNGFVVTDLDIQTFWDTSIGQHSTKGLLVEYTSGNRGAAYLPTTPYSTTADADSDRVQHYAQECVRQLEQVFPGISTHYDGVASLSYPTGDPYLLGSYSCWRVGQYTHFGGYEGVRQGRIHFAGEHCSVDWQGYMEGGAREGARAAREIVQDSEN